MIMSLENLEDLFLHDLKDTYDAERRMTKALPKMAKAASSQKLQAAFEKHLSVTETQIERLERIFKLLNKPVRGKKCSGMEGLIEEGSELMSEDASESTLDAGLIGAAQKVEHYEIAAYGTMATYAKILGLTEAERLLKQTLAEEKQTDEELTQLASTINFESEHEDEGPQEGDGSAQSRRGSGQRRRSQSNRTGRPKFLRRMGKALAGFVQNK
jgi:ferritin-like metal-binding protein YciE